jgi:xanthine dehydrogenase accessory factor
MNDWSQIARNYIASGQRCALLTVTRTEGSTPREAGARMLICGAEQHGTIGGGKLELDATERARALVASDAVGELSVTQIYSLGATLGQCCGGRMELLIQRLGAEALPSLDRVLARPPGLHVVLFGAGHVGRALVHVLSPLGWSIDWVETRDDQFPAGLSANVEAAATDVPEACVDEAPSGSAFVIMTHDHALDYQLCERVLARGDFAYCGLIGSRTKRSKFEHRLAARGFSAEQIARIVCPIGVTGVPGKSPFEVAIAAAAQLVQVNGERRR